LQSAAPHDRAIVNAHGAILRDMTRLDDVLPRSITPPTWRTRTADIAIGSIPLAVGSISSLATMSGLRVWYRTLERPSWKPPDAAFGPVWTTLYALMGVALVRVVRAPERSSGGSSETARAIGLGLFAVQLALNGAWSWFFFSEHALGAALAEILVLWLAILATIGAFASVRPSAAALLVPYLGWVTFATVLTAWIWQHNR
jgi:tryptophan-rich sensory protein